MRWVETRMSLSLMPASLIATLLYSKPALPPLQTPPSFNATVRGAVASDMPLLAKQEAIGHIGRPHVLCDLEHHRDGLQEVGKHTVGRGQCGELGQPGQR